MWRKRNGSLRAIDANAVHRYLTGGDSDQPARARATVDGGVVFAGTSVLLEGERIVRSIYGYAAEEVAPALRAFAGPPGVAVEHPGLVAKALDRTEAGIDFADTVHRGHAVQCDATLTLDRQFIEQAQGSMERMPGI